MKITATKIKRELIKNYGYYPFHFDIEHNVHNHIVKDVLKIIDKIIKEQKGFSIKN